MQTLPQPEASPALDTGEVHETATTFEPPQQCLSEMKIHKMSILNSYILLRHSIPQINSHTHARTDVQACLRICLQQQQKKLKKKTVNITYVHPWGLGWINYSPLWKWNPGGRLQCEVDMRGLRWCPMRWQCRLRPRMDRSLEARKQVLAYSSKK